MASEEGAAALPDHSEHDHAINLLLGKMPPWKLVYALSTKELEVLKQYIEENLNKG